MSTKSIAHKFVSAVADDANAAHVRPSNWNADHNFFLGVNAQTGTSYTFVDGDDWCLASFNNAGAIAATLPAANSSTFVSGWVCFVRNLGAGTLTITPTTSTIDGAATLVLLSGHSAIIVSDGTNYTTLPMANLPIIVASGKTITLNNTITINGTDNQTYTLPGASDTLAGLGTAQTFTKQNIFNEATTVASASGAALDDVKVSAATTTITGTTTITRLAKVGLYQPTIDKPSGAVTITDAATLYIDNAPVATNAAVITNAWALLVGAGQSKFGGNVTVSNNSTNLTTIQINNTTAGGGTTFYMNNDLNHQTQVGTYGSTRAAYGAISADNGWLYTVSPGLVLMADNASGVIKFATAGNSEKMRLDANGYLGIGQSTPLTFLHLKGANVSFRGQLTIESSDYAQITLYGGATTSTNIGTQFLFDVANHNTIIQAYNGTSAAAGTMTINATTLTIGAALSVSGTLATTDTITTTKSLNGNLRTIAINVSGGTGATSGFQAGNGSATAEFAIGGTAYVGYGAFTANSALMYSANAAGIAIMADNGAATIRLAGGGNATTMSIGLNFVQIPQTSGSALSIGGGGVSFGLTSITFSQVTNWGLAINNSNAANGAIFIDFLSNGTAIGTLTNNNNVGVLLNNVSDRDLKEDPRPFTRAREIINATRIWDYRWRSNKKRGIGPFAQELYEITRDVQPGLVTPSKEKGGWMWDSHLYVPILIAGQQDANRRLDRIEQHLGLAA